MANSRFSLKRSNKSDTIRSEDEEIPCFTQEGREDVDVLWDYNSPKHKQRSMSKVAKMVNSPKVVLRRYTSQERMKQDFSTLREEFRALKAEIAQPDQDSLILSPHEEEQFQNACNDDPFDDGMDDQLLMLTQNVENQLESKSSVFNDSLDGLLSQIEIPDIEPQQPKQSIIHMQGRVEWNRTQSFENSSSHYVKPLKASENICANKCSPEEIERKRQQAMAKLQAKRQQEFIEKKRQEALKLREQRRKLMASQVKSSLHMKL